MYIDKQFDMQKIHVQRRIQINFVLTKIKEKFDIKIILLEILHEYEELNNKNKIYELSNHDSNNHAIDLKKKARNRRMSQFTFYLKINSKYCVFTLKNI